MRESENQSHLNPYAPTVEVASDAMVPEEPFAVRLLSVKQTIRRWTIICIISATPSFFWGYIVTSGQVLGMLAGVTTFIGLYSLLDYRTASTSFRQSRTIYRTLRITYITRIAISIIFPIAFYLDLLCGIAVVSLMESFDTGFSPGRDGPALGFASTYITTILQGFAMNIVLAIYGLLVHLVQWTILALNRSGTPSS